MVASTDSSDEPSCARKSGREPEIIISPKFGYMVSAVNSQSHCDPRHELTLGEMLRECTNSGQEGSDSVIFPGLETGLAAPSRQSASVGESRDVRHAGVRLRRHRLGLGEAVQMYSRCPEREGHLRHGLP